MSVWRVGIKIKRGKNVRKRALVSAKREKTPHLRYRGVITQTKENSTKMILHVSLESCHMLSKKDP
jgi:hypothetical protein